MTLREIVETATEAAAKQREDLSKEVLTYWNQIVDMHILRKSHFAKFAEQFQFTWFERVFCKRLVKQVQKLEDEIKSLNSKPVKWEHQTIADAIDLAALQGAAYIDMRLVDPFKKKRRKRKRK